MATHDTGRASPRTACLPDAVPFDLPAVSRLSWELGSRVVSSERRLDQWEHRESGRQLAVYEATGHTVVLRVRTPVGRERFYGAPRADFDAKRSHLRDADDWRRRS